MLFRILRIIFTVLLVIFLIGTGSIALVAYSVQEVILDSSYFSEDLLYSGAYTKFFNYILDNSSKESSIVSNAIEAIPEEIINSIKPAIFSSLAADYSSDWMDYLLGKIPSNEIPLLNFAEHTDTIYHSAILASEDEEFLLSLLSDVIESKGYDLDNYTKEEQLSLLETYKIKKIYIESVDNAFTDENSFFYKTAIDRNPLALLSYALPELSQEELISDVKSNHGILSYYKSIVYLVFAGMLACLGIIFIMWLNYLKVPLLTSGIITILISLPVFIISFSKNAFNSFMHMLEPLIPLTIPSFETIDFHGNFAIWPVVNHMLTVSTISLIVGVLFLVGGILADSKKKKPKNTF